MDNNNLENKNLESLENKRQSDTQMQNKVYKETEIQTNIDNKKQREFKKKEYRITKVAKLIYYILGVLEVLFAFRFVFKILGANTESTFVSFIYSTSNLFLKPFSGIFRTAVSEGIETKSVLEPTLIIGMIVYALLAWGIVKLIEISNHKEI
ncbi:MAG: hypothetical protein ACYDEX_01185 [Mobilitalea sp.]